jgi:hypothetical protein
MRDVLNPRLVIVFPKLSLDLDLYTEQLRLKLFLSTKTTDLRQSLSREQ